VLSMLFLSLAISVCELNVSHVVRV